MFATVTGFGQSASTPAMIATTSVSVGVGEMSLTPTLLVGLESDMVVTLRASVT